jgi:hypothetical protein
MRELAGGWRMYARLYRDRLRFLNSPSVFSLSLGGATTIHPCGIKLSNLIVPMGRRLEPMHWVTPIGNRGVESNGLLKSYQKENRFRQSPAHTRKGPYVIVSCYQAHHGWTVAPGIQSGSKGSARRENTTPTNSWSQYFPCGVFLQSTESAGSMAQREGLASCSHPIPGA